MAVLQIKIEKAKSQPTADAVVASDIVDMARISGAAVHQLRKGRGKVIFGCKGARKVSESTKDNYAVEALENFYRKVSTSNVQ